MDIAIAALFLYASIWLYELANQMVLSLSGQQASISVAGFLPIGTASISFSPAAQTYAKLLQVGSCSALVLMFLFLASRQHLLITKLVSCSVLAVYLASLYWEVLPMSSSYPLHDIAFIGVAGLVNLAVVLPMTRRQA